LLVPLYVAHVVSYSAQTDEEFKFALANWIFIDAAVLSAHAHSPWGDKDSEPPVHVTFVDWVPGICSFLGYLVINIIDKDRVRGEEGFGDSRAVWSARLILFIGFALMAGGLAGSVVRDYSCLVARADRTFFSRC
jgi:Uncharacterised protein family (UPF0220)